MNGHSAHGLMNLGQLLLQTCEKSLSAHSEKDELVRQLAATSAPNAPDTEEIAEESDDSSDSCTGGNAHNSAWCICDDLKTKNQLADPTSLLHAFEQALAEDCLGELIEVMLYDEYVPTSAIEILMPRFVELYADTKRNITLQPNADDQLWSRGMKEWATKIYKIMRLRYGDEW